MFNALNGLGGAGQLGKDVSAGDASNSALYAAFAVVGFFAGSVVNALGIRASLAFGGLGYCRSFQGCKKYLLTRTSGVYVSSYLCFNHTKNLGYVIFSGLLLGCCAGVLWAAQGAIMMVYLLSNLLKRTYADSVMIVLSTRAKERTIYFLVLDYL